MPRSVSWIFAVMMLSIALVPGIVSAQADDDARKTVLGAVQATNALDGFHLKMKGNYQSIITQPDGFVTNTYTIQTIEGDVGQDGDRQFTRQLQSADTFENAAKADPLVIEQVISDGTTYVNFQTENEAITSMLNIQAGWWEYDKLVESSESAVVATLIKQYSQSDIPLDTLFRDEILLTVTELVSEMQNGISLRVFDMELDAVQLALEATLEQNAVAEADQEQVLADKQDLFDASELTATYRLWIGADDGLVHRGRGDQRTFIPFSTAGGEDDPNFDIDANWTAEFSITQHGEAVAITPPDPATLNE
jgi:hypothetical protein